MIRPEHQDFLLNRLGALRVKHSGRSLYDHLRGTHTLLKLWGNSDTICNAGLFHSIYGTNKFRRKCWPLDDRGTIAGLIGILSEELVYRFCTSDRPRVFVPEDPGKDNAIWRSLREIEMANLIEQNSRSRWLPIMVAVGVSKGARKSLEQTLCAT